MYNVLLVGWSQWYIWAALSICILCALAACSLWRKCRCSDRPCALLRRAETSRRPTRRRSRRRRDTDDSRSDLDSAHSSCCAPPHYSRCGSFHRAPPPYSEVASKPDLYPLVISYGPAQENGMKRGGSASYLMVQYFRNYILRPSGSISATSTIDSLSSSFICNAVNEANTIVPPPYSCTGSLDGFSLNPSTQDIQMLHSVSSVICNELQQNASQSQSSIQATPHPSPSPTNHASSPQNSSHQTTPTPKQTYVAKTTSFVSNCGPSTKIDEDKILNEVEKRTLARNFIQGGSIDSETSQGEEHNFSELLNLSVCASSVVNCDIQQVEPQYSIANSITVSDISSLANLGTPDSPPRATSPTVEIRELLDKIQQLPQQKSPTYEVYTEAQPTNSKFFVRNKSKTLYMPLNSNKISPKQSIFAGTSSIFSYAGKTTRAWLSRSAPTTPCGNFTPIFPKTGSHKGSRLKVEDASALLESGDCENNTDECL